MNVNIALRRFVGVVAAIGIAMLALPATAQNVKYFELKQTVPNPTQKMPVTTTNVTVTFKNIDNGNSSFNSIGIKGYFKTGTGTIKVLSAVSSPGTAGTPLDIGDGYFYLTNAGPFKKGQTMTVAMTVQITNASASGCDDQTIAWHGRAFTGSPTQPATEFQQSTADPEVTVAMGCTYSYTITDKIYKGDKDKTLTATVANPAGSQSSIGGITFKTPYPAGIVPSAFTPSGFPIAANGTGTVDITASAPCDVAGTGGAWTTEVTGFQLSGGEKSTAVAGNCVLGFVSPPSSIVPGEPFSVTIKLYNDASNSTITTFTGNVTVVVDGTGCTVVGDPSLAAAAGEAKLTVTLDAGATATTCSIKAKTTIGTTEFFSSPLSLAVFDGLLGCTSTTFDALDLPATGAGTTGAGTFDASEGGATAPGETGFLAGVRGYDPAKGVCSDTAKANYAVFNNLPIGNTGTMTDPLNNVVAEGFYSLTWDASQVDPVSGQLLRPVVAVIATLRPEWGDALTGLPTKQTLICTVTPCTAAPSTVSGAINTAGGWKPAVACLSTLVLHSSIPAGEPGCLASERWDVVGEGDAEYCTTTPPAKPAGAPDTWKPRCLKPTSIMLMGQDPVFGRGT